MAEDLFGYDPDSSADKGEKQNESTGTAPGTADTAAVPDNKTAEPATETVQADSEAGQEDPESHSTEPVATAPGTETAQADSEAGQEDSESHSTEPAATAPGTETVQADSEAGQEDPESHSAEPAATAPATETAQADSEAGQENTASHSTEPATTPATETVQADSEAGQEDPESHSAEPAATAPATETAQADSEAGQENTASHSTEQATPGTRKTAQADTAAGQQQQLYFWQQHAWQQLQSRLANLPHAILIHAPEGYAIEEFARRLCRSILVTGTNSRQLAALFDSDNHPELMTVKPDGRTTGIDAVREGISWLGLRSIDPEQRRILVLQQADSMPRGAANAILKCLEEPPGNGLILLISTRAHNLPATITSRCVQVSPCHAEIEEMKQWLYSELPQDQHTAADMLLLAGYGPLAVLQHLDQQGYEIRSSVFRFLSARDMARAEQAVPELAKSWQGMGLDKVMLWLRVLLLAAIRGHLGDENTSSMTTRLAVRDLPGLLNFHQEIVYNEYLYHNHGGINEVSLLEDLMLDWQGMAGQGTTTAPYGGTPYKPVASGHYVVA